MTDDTIRWLFGSVWRVVGAYMLLALIGETIVKIIKAFFPSPIKPEVHIYTAPLNLSCVDDPELVADAIRDSLAKSPVVKAHA